MATTDTVTEFDDLHPFEKSIAGKRVLVTGHTGFTGGWLCLWLSAIGAEVSGLSLAPITSPNLFDALDVEKFTHSHIGNINDHKAVTQVFNEDTPEVVFHLAAQPLVSHAYDDPLESFRTNIIGTANILEAARQCETTKAVVCVTTDKVYFDQDPDRGYREDDRLGGKDPYSASKAAAEIVAQTYQCTLAERANGVAIATARGGNIIGGGDWSDDRIVPDFVRAHTGNKTLVLRNPSAIRPWQHVIALCHGYLALADQLLSGEAERCSAYNFGPADSDVQSVGELVDTMSRIWPGTSVEYGDATFAETQVLMVDSAKARSELGWQPPIDLSETVEWTANWYKSFYENPASAPGTTKVQINTYRGRIAA